MRRLADIVLTVTVGVALGILAGFLLSLTHGAPSADNASPPPDGFDYPFGILIGLAVAVMARMIGWPLWAARQRRSAGS
jgi:hypothetical protein